MNNLDVWTILGIGAIICLIVSFFIGKNSIWGTLTLGIIVSVVVGLYNWIFNDGFNWDLTKKILTVSILLGVLFEIIGRMASKKK